MTENEIDFDDVSLEPTTSVDELLDPIVKETPETTEIVEVKKEKGKPGPKPKVKDATVEGVTDDTTTEATTEEGTTTEETNEKSDVEENFIQTMAKKIGIEIPEGMEFSDDEDGLIEFNDYLSDIKADNKLNTYFEGLPPVAGDFFDFLDLIKEDPDREDKIKEFFTSVKPEIDYKSIDLENVDTQKAIMKTMMKKQGYTDADIKEELEDMEVAGTLKRQSEKASKVLASTQEKEREVLLAKEKEEANIKKANNQRFFNKVKETIEAGKVNNFTIPVTEKKAAFDYDVSGQFMKDINEALQDPIRRTELATALRNKFNLSKYITQAAATKKAEGLRSKIAQSNGRLKSASSYGGNPNTTIDWDSEV